MWRWGTTTIASTGSAQRPRLPALLRSTEALLVDPQGMQLETATPLQRALCRVIDGKPMTGLEISTIEAALGTTIDRLPTRKPKHVVILAGIRGAKSTIAAATGIRWSQIAKVEHLRRDEPPPRVSIVSVSRDLAQVTWQHLQGAIEGSQELRQLLRKPPTDGRIELIHPSDRPIEICVVAGRRAGASLISRWSAGCIFDEAPRMRGQGEAIVNWATMFEAVVGRLLPGSQVLSIGSPDEPHGPMYSLFVERHGNPGEDVCIFKAPGWLMNPVWWTPERCEQLRKESPSAYWRDCAAEFSAGEDAFLSPADLDECTVADASEPPDGRLTYVAGMDPATRGNGWSVVVACRDGAKTKIVAANEWRGSSQAPLSPADVLREITEWLRPYRVTQVWSDHWSGDALRDLARMAGLQLVALQHSSGDMLAIYNRIATMVGTHALQLPRIPMLLEDLRRLRKRTSAGAGYAISLPHTSDGRHCDFVPALALAVAQPMPDRRPLPLPDAKREEDRMIKAIEREMKLAKNPWRKVS